MLQRIIRLGSVVAAAGIVLLPYLLTPSAMAVTCTVTPDNVPITLNYNGAELAVSGENVAGDDLIIRITSEAAEAHYKYKGKAGGLFWMKKGDVSFENVPGVYLLYSTREMENLLDPENLRANLIGFDALKEASTMVTESAELQGQDARWKNEFIRFKEKLNLYAVRTGTVTRQHGQTSDTYALDVQWPSQAVPGTYTVEALAIRNGKVVERANSQFNVEQAGMVKLLSELAFENAALYGIMAVVIAIIAGFAVGMIFKKGGGAH
jgi:uncharacterized protein (TIGR02186 family)